MWRPVFDAIPRRAPPCDNARSRRRNLIMRIGFFSTLTDSSVALHRPGRLTSKLGQPHRMTGRLTPWRRHPASRYEPDEQEPLRGPTKPPGAISPASHGHAPAGLAGWVPAVGLVRPGSGLARGGDPRVLQEDGGGAAVLPDEPALSLARAVVEYAAVLGFGHGIGRADQGPAAVRRLCEPPAGLCPGPAAGLAGRGAIHLRRGLVPPAPRSRVPAG